MATLPWKSNVGGPSDEELNRVVQAHEEDQRKEEEQRRDEVRRLVADPEVYDHRLAERGYREYTFWGKGRYRGRRLTNITRAHTASRRSASPLNSFVRNPMLFRLISAARS